MKKNSSDRRHHHRRTSPASLLKAMLPSAVLHRLRSLREAANRRPKAAVAILLTATTLILPRPSIAQADQRPMVTIAVQKIANTNTLETLREQSNVGTRTWGSYAETLIEQDWSGDLSLRPQLAESWRRIDDRTVELLKVVGNGNVSAGIRHAARVAYDKYQRES